MTHLSLIVFIVVVFCSFIAYVWYHHGVQTSISASWYALEKKSPLFTLCLFAIGFSLAIIGGLNENVLYFLAGSCLCFTGAAAQYKQKMTATVHYVGAYGGIGLSAFGLAYHPHLLWPFWGLVLAIAVIKKFKIANATWWIEIAAFEFIVAGLIKENLL